VFIGFIGQLCLIHEACGARGELLKEIGGNADGGKEMKKSKDGEGQRQPGEVNNAIQRGQTGNNYLKKKNERFDKSSPKEVQ